MIDARWVEAKQAFSIELNASARWRVDTGDDIEERGLTCAVWADDADDLAFINCEVKFAD